MQINVELFEHGLFLPSVVYFCHPQLSQKLQKCNICTRYKNKADSASHGAVIFDGKMMQGFDLSLVL